MSEDRHELTPRGANSFRSGASHLLEVRSSVGVGAGNLKGCRPGRELDALEVCTTPLGKGSGRDVRDERMEGVRGRCCLR